MGEVLSKKVSVSRQDRLREKYRKGNVKKRSSRSTKSKEEKIREIRARFSVIRNKLQKDHDSDESR